MWPKDLRTLTFVLLTALIIALKITSAANLPEAESELYSLMKQHLMKNRDAKAFLDESPAPSSYQHALNLLYYLGYWTTVFFMVGLCMKCFEYFSIILPGIILVAALITYISMHMFRCVTFGKVQRGEWYQKATLKEIVTHFFAKRVEAKEGDKTEAKDKKEEAVRNASNQVKEGSVSSKPTTTNMKTSPSDISTSPARETVSLTEPQILQYGLIVREVIQQMMKHTAPTVSDFNIVDPKPSPQAITKSLFSQNVSPEGENKLFLPKGTFNNPFPVGGPKPANEMFSSKITKSKSIFSDATPGNTSPTFGVD